VGGEKLQSEALRTPTPLVARLYRPTRNFTRTARWEAEDDPSHAAIVRVAWSNLLIAAVLSCRAATTADLARDAVARQGHKNRSGDNDEQNGR
jgi:hypothetical protein